MNNNGDDRKMERSGLGVGIITRGDVSIKSITHMDKIKSQACFGSILL